MAIVKDTIYEVEYDGFTMEFQSYVYSHNGQRRGANYVGVGREEKVTVEVMDTVVTGDTLDDSYYQTKTAELLVFLPDVERYAIFKYDYVHYPTEGGYENAVIIDADFILDMPAEGN